MRLIIPKGLSCAADVIVLAVGATAVALGCALFWLINIGELVSAMALWGGICAALLGLHVSMGMCIAIGAVLIGGFFALYFTADYYDFRLDKYPRLHLLVLYSVVTLFGLVFVGLAGAPAYLVATRGFDIQLTSWADWVLGAAIVLMFMKPKSQPTPAHSHP